MATATIDLPNGTKIVIEGSVEDVARIVTLVQGTPSIPRAGGKRPGPAKKAKAGTKDYIRELVAEGFFKEKRSLGEVKSALEARGQLIKLTSLSGPMLELVRDKELERIKVSRKWMYLYSG